MTSISGEVEALAETFIEAVRATYPIDVDFGIKDPSQAFALAGLARMTELLAGETRLYLDGQWSIARILGRAIREVWLMTLYLCLAPNDAMQELDAADALHSKGIKKGIVEVNEYLRGAGIGALPEWSADEGEGSPKKLNMRDVAQKVDDLLVAEGRPRGRAKALYEVAYRLESGDDVHPSNFDFFFRYFEPTDAGFKVLSSPDPNGYRTPKPNEELRSDVLGVLDALRYVSRFADPSLFHAVSSSLAMKVSLKVLPLGSDTSEIEPEFFSTDFAKRDQSLQDLDE